MVSFENSKLYYLDIGNRGRAGGIRLLLHDAGVSFQDNRLSFAKWAQFKPTLFEKYPTAVLPVMETAGGQYFGATVPLMHLLGKELGYTPTELQEASLVEQTADLASSFLHDFIKPMFQPDQLEYHKTVELPLHVARFERIYGARPSGPYVLGVRITYADFLVYDILRQEEILNKLQTSPNLAAFVKAFEERPKIKPYLATFPEKEPELVVQYVK
ncbi:hypothetical protein BJV82DRAFT_579309 [Fennellomyces sp. T-0311]|nr:hypothetical protein BJV82DRAFT_579309 [Fennellomyces sp. T-0311]